MLYCPECGGQNEDDADYCIKCGAPLREGMRRTYRRDEKDEKEERIEKEEKDRPRAHGHSRRPILRLQRPKSPTTISTTLEH